MTDTGPWDLGRAETQTDTAPDGDLVMLVPPVAGAAPRLRSLGGLRSDIGQANPPSVVPGVARLLYFEERQVNYHASSSGPYRLPLISLPGLDVAEGDDIVVWLDVSDPSTTVTLMDDVDLANAGPLSDGVPVVDGFAVLTATADGADGDTPTVAATGDHGTAEDPETLRYRIHGVWQAVGANDLGIGAIQAAVQTAVDPESFPPPYDANRGWAPGEHFWLADAIYRVEQHSIAVASDDVDASDHFRKIVDGAASRNDDINARVAPWAQSDFAGPVISKGATDGVPDLTVGGTTVVLPVALVDSDDTAHTGLMSGADKVRLDTARTTVSSLLARVAALEARPAHEPVSSGVRQIANGAARGTWVQLGGMQVSEIPSGAVFTARLRLLTESPTEFIWQRWPATLPTLAEGDTVSTANRDGWPVQYAAWATTFGAVPERRVMRLARTAAGLLLVALPAGTDSHPGPATRFEFFHLA